MDSQIHILPLDHHQLKDINDPFYCAILMEQPISFTVNFTPYQTNGKSLIFLSPYQLLQWKQTDYIAAQLLQFHGDFYCIEYHKEEVACNGVLFNNIYQQPYIDLDDVTYAEIQVIFEKIKALEASQESYNQSVLKSYLQLILALSSREKLKQVDHPNPLPKSIISGFQILLEHNFLQEKSVAFYANHYGLSVDAFSKKVKKEFNKAPSKLIKERLTLEAKKLIHLTHKSIKEIAIELGFEDEFYFSRYFKVEVGVSPKMYREQVGISIVAK